MKRKILEVIIILLLTFLLAEIVLRLLGYQPYIQEEFTIQTHPKSSMVLHPSLGMGLRPGTFNITLNKALKYKVTHNKDSLRITSNTIEDLAKPQIHFHGCSFTYGMGVNDHQTFPFLVQQALGDHYLIKNIAVPGYGNLQGYLRTKSIIETNQEKPKIIFAFYAPFHQERNVLSSNFRAQMYYNFSVLSLDKISYSYPFISLDNEDLVFQETKNIYNPIFGKKNFAIMNAIQESIHSFKNKRISAHQSTLLLFEKWNQLCQEEEIEFIVASILKDDESQFMLEALKEKDVKTLDIALDILNDNQLNQLPYDSHPSELAHQIYAEQLINYLQPNPFH